VFQEGADAVVEQHFVRWRGCRMAPIADLVQARPMNSENCCAPPPPMPPAVWRPLEDLSQRQNAGAVRLLAQMR